MLFDIVILFVFVVNFVVYCFVLVNDRLFVYCGVLDAG